MNRILFYGQCVSLFPGFATAGWPKAGLKGSASLDWGRIQNRVGCNASLMKKNRHYKIQTHL